MLLFEDERRLVVLGDREGTGKSQLLQRLKFNCDYRLQVPASLVLLESNPDTSKGRKTVTSAIDFVDWLRSDLAKHLSFPRYDRLNEFRVNYIWAPFAQPLDIVQGLPQAAQVQMTVDKVEGGAVTGVHIETLNLQPPTTWPNREQERLANQKCIEAFLLDLRHAAARHPVVLLIDSYERAQPGLDDWIVDEFIQPLLLAQEGSPRAERLLVVLAGHEDKLPPFQQMLAEKFERLVASLELLGWTKDHVRDLLKAHNLHVSDDNFKIVYGKVQKGVSIKGALALAQLLMTLERSES